MNALNHRADAKEFPTELAAASLQGLLPLEQGDSPSGTAEAGEVQGGHMLRSSAFPNNRGIDSIRSEYAPKLFRQQEAARLAQAEGNPTLAISLLFDFVCQESMMIYDMARLHKATTEDFNDQRFIRRADIDLLLNCALEVEDHDAKLLAELLLMNQQRYFQTALDCGAGQGTLFSEALL